MRLIDADQLKSLSYERLIHTDYGETAIPIEEIDNVPTVEPTFGVFKAICCDECEKCQNAYDEGYEFGITTQRPQGDLISRDCQERKNAFKEGYKQAIIDGKTNFSRQPGEWQLHGMIYYCSVCGHYCEQGGNNFCGNCGADMRGKKE